MKGLLLLIGAIVSVTAFSVSAQKEWVEQSNAFSQQVLQVKAQFFPEKASYFGLSEYDGFVVDLGADVAERQIAAYQTLISQLTTTLTEQKDNRVKQDIAILIKSLEQSVQREKLDKQYLIRWENLPQFYYQAIAMLLSEQANPERQSKALERLQRYVGLHPNSHSLTEQAKVLFHDSLSPQKLAPFRREIESALESYPEYLAGIKQLFELGGIQGAETVLAELENQVQDYMKWTETTVLPLARDDFREPEEMYSFRLKTAGIDISAASLMAKAKVEFYETRATMQAMAPLVAKKLNISARNYQDVIRELKKSSIKDSELENTYKKVNENIEQIVRDNHIVSLPDAPLLMRLSTKAEAAAQLVPHMQPPPLLENTGEQGIFILPVSLSDSSTMSYNDFNFSAAAWTLSAHEARPGHELQFASMLKTGVSQARAIFAFNSVNVEGWALYAEAELVPYEPIEAQMIAMQHRLLRAARAFLDPMLNLGLMDVKQATKILEDEVVLSPAMVKQEIDRYTYRNPGQATSYFYGYTRLLDTRITTELILGDRFDQLKFNDFILQQGLLSPDLLDAAVAEQFIPSQLN